MNIYELGDSKYDVSKLTPKAQELFSLLVIARKRGDAHREDLFFITKACNNLVEELNSLCDPSALIEDKQEIDNIIRDVPTFVE